MFENISFTGIIPLEYYPDKKYFEHCKQDIEKISVTIPYQKPDIESIDEVKVCIDITDYKSINTILGPKIIINGKFTITIIYTANNCAQSIHSAHWCIPFYNFILLKNISPTYAENVSYIFSALEDISVNFCHFKTIDLSILYILCPIFYNRTCNDKYNFEDKCHNQKCCKNQNDYNPSKCFYNHNNLFEDSFYKSDFSNDSFNFFE